MDEGVANLILKSSEDSSKFGSLGSKLISSVKQSIKERNFTTSPRLLEPNYDEIIRNNTSALSKFADKNDLCMIKRNHWGLLNPVVRRRIGEAQEVISQTNIYFSMSEFHKNHKKYFDFETDEGFSLIHLLVENRSTLFYVSTSKQSDLDSLSD